MATLEEYHQRNRQWFLKYPIFLAVLVAIRVGMKLLGRYTNWKMPSWGWSVYLIVMGVCAGVLIVLDVTHRNRELKRIEQLEQEQENNPTKAPTLDAYFQENRIQAQQKLHQERKESRHLAEAEQKEAQQLEQLNQESTTEWW